MGILERILVTPTTQLGKASRFAAFMVKLSVHCIRLLRKNRAGQQAAALSYHTIFGIVPLTIVTLMVFQLSPSYGEVGEKIKNFFYDQANLSAFKTAGTNGGESAQDSGEPLALTEHLDKLVNSFFKGTHKGSIGIVSVLLVAWAAIGLLSTVEKAFNHIWHVGRGRNLLARIINYWALLTLGPLVVGAGIYASSQYSGVFTHIGPLFLGYIFAAIAFFLLYFMLPNAKVHFTSAVWGSLVGALVWVAAKNIYGYCATGLNLYKTVYGMLALIPITVMWIHITWLIVLFGLQLAYTSQHLKTLDAAEIAASKPEEHFMANDFTVINVMREVAAAFTVNAGPVSGEEICEKLNMPAEFGEKIFNHLVDVGLLAKTSEPRVGFVPGQDPASVRLSDISAAVASASFAQDNIKESKGLENIARSHRKSLAEHSLREIVDVERDN